MDDDTKDLQKLKQISEDYNKNYDEYLKKLQDKRNKCFSIADKYITTVIKENEQIFRKIVDKSEKREIYTHSKFFEQCDIPSTDNHEIFGKLYAKYRKYGWDVTYNWIDETMDAAKITIRPIREEKETDSRDCGTWGRKGQR